MWLDPSIFFRPLFFHFATFLCRYPCTNIFISYTPTNILPSVSLGQVISVRFRTVEDQFRSQDSQYGASGRQRGTVLRCQFSFHICPVLVHRSFGYVRTTDTLLATVRRLKGPDPKFTSNVLSVPDRSPSSLYLATNTCSF